MSGLGVAEIPDVAPGMAAPTCRNPAVFPPARAKRNLRGGLPTQGAGRCNHAFNLAPFSALDSPLQLIGQFVRAGFGQAAHELQAQLYEGTA